MLLLLQRRSAVDRPALGQGAALPQPELSQPKRVQEGGPLPAEQNPGSIKEPYLRRAAPSRTICREAERLCLRT